VGPQAESLLGYSVQHWFRREGWLSLIHPDDHEIATQFMYPPASHPGPETDFQAEFRLRSIDGRVFWFRELVRYARGEDQRLRARGFLFDITQAKMHEQELQRARDQLRQLTLRDQTVREDERANVAREIHDELGQALTMFRIDLDWLENRLVRTAVLDLDALKDKTEQMKKMVDGTLHTVRRVISSLRPAVLDELGLKAAIEWQAQEFSRRAGIRCAVQADFVENVDKEVSIAVFRIFQELLTNVLRHSRASRVNVQFSSEPASLNLSVRDNGRGFSMAEAAGKKSFGLLGMRERVSALGGRFEISSNVGEGTAVTVSLPFTVKPA
jgi:PAS domain S-box-containing protein